MEEKFSPKTKLPLDALSDVELVRRRVGTAKALGKDEEAAFACFNELPRAARLMLLRAALAAKKDFILGKDILEAEKVLEEPELEGDEYANLEDDTTDDDATRSEFE